MKKLQNRLKRCVAPILRSLSAGRDARPGSVSDASGSYGEVMRLAGPIAIAMLGDTAMGLVDTKLVAGLGRAALGGVGLGTTLMFVVYAIVFGFMRGVKVRVAHAVGGGRSRDATSYAVAGLAVAALAGGLTFVVTRQAGPLLRLVGADAEMVPYGEQFLAARGWGAPAACAISALIQYRQGLGDARTPMIAGLLANVINAALAYGLIYGHFGLPALGVAGAGYGTALAETAELAFLGSTLVRSLASEGRPSLGLRDALGQVASLGAPTGLQFGCEMLAFTTFTAIIGSLGAREIASHQVALSIMRTSFLPGMAVGEAASVLVGKALGGRDLAAADRATRAGIVLAATFMTACGVLFALFGGRIGAQFTDDVEVAARVGTLLLAAAVFQAFDGVTIVLRGALRGAKDVRVVAFVGISVAWVCVPGAALVLGKHAGLGALGGWMGWIAETSIAAGIFWWRWSRGSWREDYPTPSRTVKGESASDVPSLATPRPA